MWCEIEGLNYDDWHQTVSVDNLLGILDSTEPASTEIFRNNDVVYLIFIFRPPLPQQYIKRYMEIFDRNEDEFEVRIWIDTNTGYLVRGTISSLPELPVHQEISQAFTCFGEDVIVEPPPWLNLTPDEEGKLTLTNNKLPIVPHHP